MKNTYLSILMVSLMILIGCSSDDTIQQPINELELFNDIIGTITIYDDEQTSISDSGVTVTIAESDPPITAVTDPDGNYALKNVPYGTRTLIYEKEGIGTFKVFDVEHEDIGEFTLIPNELELGQISRNEILENSVVVSGNFIILTVERPISDNLIVERMRIFYHKSEDISNEFYTEFSPLVGSSNNPVNLTFSIAFFKSLGFESGDTLWFRVYSDNFYDNVYEDPDEEITVFPNLNPNTPDAVSVIIP